MPGNERGIRCVSCRLLLLSYFLLESAATFARGDMRKAPLVPEYGFAIAACALAVICPFVQIEGYAQVAVPSIVSPGGISFSSLSGPNFSAYTGHTEGDFTITPTAGTWRQSI